ncbi:MAG: hypothetical protein ACSLFK_07630 [Gemmatimonadaceae bacterium]
MLSSSPQGPLGTTEGDWKYAARAGETITLDMRSTEFDPFLTLHSVGSTVTRVAQDDNGGGELNSRIVYRGSYTLAFRSSARAVRLIDIG